MHNRIVKKWWKKKNMTLGWKPENGSLEQKQEKFQRLVGGANRRMKGQRSDSIQNLYKVLYPSQNQKFELFVPKCLLSNSRTYHSGSWRLSNCHIQKQQKWIFLRCLIFKEFIFPKKGPWKRATPFAQLNCENKSFESDHQIPKSMPIQRFLTVITNFFLGTLSQKEDDFS